MRSGNLGRNREILEAFDDLICWFRSEGLLERYYDPLCRLAMEHVLLAASVRVARIDPKAPLLKEIEAYMREHFPNYHKNPYYSWFSMEHKLLLALIRMGRYDLVRLLFRLKDRGKET